jgi:hypothetical protein
LRTGNTAQSQPGDARAAGQCLKEGHNKHQNDFSTAKLSEFPYLKKSLRQPEKKIK